MKHINRNFQNCQPGYILYEDFSVAPRLSTAQSPRPIAVVTSVIKSENMVKAIALQASAEPLIWSFGYSGTTALSGKISIVSNQDTDGENNTAAIAENAKRIKEEEILKYGQDDGHYISAVAHCLAYQTPGTQPGDWYLGAIDELLKINENFTQINKALAVCKSDLLHQDTDYWTSSEFSYEEARYYVPYDKHPLALYYAMPKECLAYVLPMIAVKGNL